ncbi:hypothetical protein BDZ97DRAFT_1920824 [Flammula alnicola]|nr:hypothetical protein BDZ97DRAFT_1920824 [Flammula alnicola]
MVINTRTRFFKGPSSYFKRDKEGEVLFRTSSSLDSINQEALFTNLNLISQMYFTTKFAGLLSIVAASVVSAQATIAARNELAELSVIFYANVNLTGASFSPSNLVQGVCNTLPCCWLDRAESVVIGPGYACTFFVYQGCEGNGTTLSKQVDSLPALSLYSNIESFICDKQIS